MVLTLGGKAEISTHVKYHQGRFGRTLIPFACGRTIDGGFSHDRAPEGVERIIADVEDFQRIFDRRMLTESDNSERMRLLGRIQGQTEEHNRLT